MKQLGAFAEEYGLDAQQQAALAALLNCLVADPTAPTTVVQPERALDVHIADSLVALELEDVRAASVVADLGAGAGLPGLALAVALPDAAVVLVESVGRKCAFMERCIAAMRIANAEVVHARAEEWTAGLGTCDVVTARALAPLNVLVEYAAPLLREGGALIAWKGRRDPAEEAAGGAAAARLGLDLEDVRAVSPFPDANARHLVVVRKVAPTPPGFPRRPGMARKRPLT